MTPEQVIVLLSPSNAPSNGFDALRAQSSIRFVSVQSSENALSLLRESPADAFLLDWRAAGEGWSELLQSIDVLCPGALRVLLVDLGNQELAIDAVSRGFAHDSMLLPVSSADLEEFLARLTRWNQALRRTELKQFLRSLNSLPSPPKFYQRLYEVIEDPRSTVMDIAHVIEQNPALVAKLLQVANSVLFGARNAISTVREAILFIGIEYIGKLITVVEVFENFITEADLPLRFRVRQLWDEALLRAPMARRIAEEEPSLSSDPNTAYIASALQDIGLLIRLLAQPGQFDRMIEIWKIQHCSLHEADREVFGITHPELGATLLELWNFPQEIVEAIAAHHQTKPQNVLARVLQLAELLTLPEPTGPFDPSLLLLADIWRKRISMQPAASA